MTSLEDVNNIPDSYFRSYSPDLPIPQLRYQYLQHLNNKHQLDASTTYMPNQPSFYYYYTTGNHQSIQSLKHQILPDDVFLNVSLSMTNLDDAIDMSLTSTLKNSVYLNMIKNNVRVIRPAVDWAELTIFHKMVSRDILSHPNISRSTREFKDTCH